LIDASLGERVTLRRTSRATGKTVVQDAIVRGSGDGVVIQTAAGVEALRCTGLPETLTTDRLPAGLSAKPTLSVRVRSPEPVEADVTLSYISNNFDWQADYVGELSDDGKRVSLFAWMTLANGDQTGLAYAQTQAVAGKLNRERVWISPGEFRPITINCWPQGTTSDIAEPVTVLDAEEIVVTGMRMASVNAPPPPPPPAPERDQKVMAQEERLGEVRLYRVPIEVTVASRSQKQIALLEQPSVKVERLLRLRTGGGDFNGLPLERLLVTRNRTAEGLGLPLPAGKLALFGRVQGRRILIGEGSLDDHTLGEKVEIRTGAAPGVLARQVTVPNAQNEYILTLTNDLPEAQTVEIELPLDTQVIKGPRLVKRDGWMLWRLALPANGEAELRYRY